MSPKRAIEEECHYNGWNVDLDLTLKKSVSNIGRANQIWNKFMNPDPQQPATDQKDEEKNSAIGLMNHLPDDLNCKCLDCQHDRRFWGPNPQPPAQRTFKCNICGQVHTEAPNGIGFAGCPNCSAFKPAQSGGEKTLSETLKDIAGHRVELFIDGKYTMGCSFSELPPEGHEGTVSILQSLPYIPSPPQDLEKVEWNLEKVEWKETDKDLLEVVQIFQAIQAGEHLIHVSSANREVTKAIAKQICEAVKLQSEWRADSSLDNWFPLSANELHTLKLRVESLRAELAKAQADKSTFATLLENVQRANMTITAELAKANEEVKEWKQICSNRDATVNTQGKEWVKNKTENNQLRDEVKRLREVMEIAVTDLMVRGVNPQDFALNQLKAALEKAV